MPVKRARTSGFVGLQSLEQRTHFSVFPPVFPPSGLSAVARSATTVQLAWNQDFTVNETGFLIERSINNIDWVQTVITPPNAVSWIDSGAEPNTLYRYRLAALSDLGTFYADENPVQVRTPATSFANADANNTLFINRTLPTDIVQITDSLTQYDVTVGTDFTVVDPSDAVRITVLQSLTDNGVVLDTSGTLFVRGTLGDDQVSISADANFFYARVNGSNVSFSLSLVNRINVLTYEGNDRISIGDGVGGVVVSAGADNDTIFSNTGDDRLDGGAGDDLIKGNAGNDRLYGGAGDDTVYGQAGNDFIQGGDGNDKLVGGDGNDYLDGGNGSDRLYGELGLDTLVGGTGFNYFKQD